MMVRQCIRTLKSPVPLSESGTLEFDRVLELI